MGVSWTDKQKRFVEEYCVDFNATQAAIRAGYSERTAYSIGHENLKKPEIAAAIEKRLDELSMGAGELLLRFTQQARNPQMQFLKPDGTVDLRGLIKAGLAHLVKGTKFDRNGNLVVEFYDGQSAQKELARIRGMIGAKGTKDDPQHVKIIIEEVSPGGASGGD